MRYSENADQIETDRFCNCLYNGEEKKDIYYNRGEDS